MAQETVPGVYGAIAAVQSAIAKVGIAKARKNAQQGYAFRDFILALAVVGAYLALCAMLEG